MDYIRAKQSKGRWSWGRIITPYLFSHLKTRFKQKNMLKMRFFAKKAANLPQRRGFCPDPPSASGGWGLRLQTHVLQH